MPLTKTSLTPNYISNTNHPKTHPAYFHTASNKVPTITSSNCISKVSFDKVPTKSNTFGKELKIETILVKFYFLCTAYFEMYTLWNG
jgi:hypothetical protein